MFKVFCILVVLLSGFCWGGPIASAGEAGSGRKVVVGKGLSGERAELISKSVKGRKSVGGIGMSEPSERVGAFSGEKQEAKEAQEAGEGDASDARERVGKSARLAELLRLRKIEKSLKVELRKARSVFRKNVTQLLRDPVLTSGVNSIYVVDVFSGSPIYSHNTKKLLNPASNVKLIASAAILDALGPSWRYETFLEGKLLGEKGNATSDLHLRGFFDPTFSAADLESLVDDLSGIGVREIKGDLFLGRGALLPKGDSLELEIVVLGKTSKIYSIVNSDTDTGEDLFTPMAQLLVLKEFPFLELESRVLIEKNAQNDVSAGFVLNSKKSERGLIQGTGSSLGKVVVSGRIRPGDMLRVSLTVHDSYIRTAKVLFESLERAGIELKGNMRIADPKRYKGEPGSGKEKDKDKDKEEEGISPLVMHRSRSVEEFVTTINKYSDNYLADSLTATLGAHVYGGAPTLKKGTAAMKRWLVWRTGIGTRNILLDTGSGLSYKTRLSARHIIRVLRVAGGFRSPTSCPPKVAGGAGKCFRACEISSPPFEGKIRSNSEIKQADFVDPHKVVSEVFRNSLAVGKKDGTLRRRMRYLNLNTELIGKTGTLTGISALSGFLSKGEDNKVAFSIVTNGADKFQPSTLRRRHGWFIGHLDAFLVSRGKLFDQLRETRKKIAEVWSAAHEAYAGREFRRVAAAEQGLPQKLGKHGETWVAPVGHGQSFGKMEDSVFRPKASVMKSRHFAGLGVDIIGLGEARKGEVGHGDGRFGDGRREEPFVFLLVCLEAQRAAISAGGVLGGISGSAVLGITGGVVGFLGGSG